MTLRQLLWMADGHHKDSWQHTSTILALIANVNRDPKKNRPFKPADFNPYLKKSSRPDAIVITSENISILRNAFLGEKSK